MSDVSKTNDLIAEARRWANGHPNRRVSELIHGLVDALEAATRVPVQGEPNGDRGALAKVMDALAYYHCRSVNQKADHPQMGYHAMSEDQREFLQERQREAAEEIVRMIPALSRAVVPDAATDKPDPCEMTHTPPFDFGQCETHDTTFPLGGVCKWHGKESVAEVLQAEVDEQRGLKVRAQLELDGLKFELADVVAERDAALAAVAAVRALHWREPGTGVDWCAHCIDNDGPWPCSTIAALDGAPEPEVKP